MKLYNPKGTSSPQQQPVKQRYNSSFPVFSWLEGLIIGSILAPISLFLGVVTLGTLVLVAFGKVDYWGETGKLLVGVFVPLILILCFVSKPIGNTIFLIWSFILICVFFVVPVLGIMYMGLKPVFEYLGL
ncbi:hypothetical protein H9X96_17445 [Pedobacter sp. N36a]|uniref:hypothetical protein n=1 Tax=Pedobacter sp. N36a TaxID=2767996 RepID=UPI0016569E35|nr:hypothetical protein [Pedobacter sp. N36a]MBC8987557.1 hypothetical protein [Pedobacter sp. N36a]